MRLLELSSKSRKKRKRVGRGNSSGHGNYSGRGIKGQNSRTGGGVRPGFEGGQMPLIRRLPKLPGFTNPSRVEYQIVNIETLENKYSEGETVDIVSLYEKGIIKNKSNPIKILGNGDLKKKLTVKTDKVSISAEEKIKKAGGTVEMFIKKTPLCGAEKPASEKPASEKSDAEKPVKK